MSSPDVSSYVDLTVFDVDASEMVDRALVVAETQLPEASFPDGALETVLLEPLALIIAEIAYALNRLPGAVLEALLLRLYAIPRSPGLPPTATVQFTASAGGAAIPMGTLVQLLVGDEPVQFATDLELTIPAGTPTGTVAVTGSELFSLANGIAAGTPLELTTAATGVTAVALASDVTGGLDAEDADTYLDRAATRLQRLSAVLVLPAHFVAYALEQPGVYRAFAIDNYDPAGGGGPGTNGGHTTVAVLGPGGAALSGPAKADLAADMDAAASAQLVLHVVDPTITAVNVTATVKVLAGYTPAAVQAACVAALQTFLSPLTWEWAATVRRNELIALLENVPGVDFVLAGHPTTPSSDLALAGVAPLATAGTLTISATA